MTECYDARYNELVQSVLSYCKHGVDVNTEEDETEGEGRQNSDAVSFVACK